MCSYTTQLVCILSGPFFSPEYLREHADILLEITLRRQDVIPMGRYEGAYSLCTEARLSGSYTDMDAVSALAENAQVLSDSGVTEIYCDLQVVYRQPTINLSMTKEQIASLAILNELFELGFLTTCLPAG